MTIFGELFGGDQIDAALIDVLQTWMPTYLKEVARQRDIDPLEPPRSYRAVSEFDRFPEEQLPAIVIVNPGTTGTPINRSGSYDASWPIEICVSTKAAKQEAARRNAHLYIVAARGCLMQRRSLGRGMKSTDWGGESYTLFDNNERRSLADAKASFVVERENVLTVGAGPSEPEVDTEPPEDFPEVESVHVEVTKQN